MPSASKRPGPISLVAGAILFLWTVFLVDLILANALGIDLARLGGLEPHTRRGLAGIVFAHFLHANFAHLIANTIGLATIGLIACWYSPALSAWAVVYSALLAGTLTWIIGSPGTIHIGASGVVFGLLGFLVANGLFRKGCLPLLIAVPIAVLYVGALPGMMPNADNHEQAISWQMHLGGFLGGALASWQFREDKPGR